MQRSKRYLLHYGQERPHPRVLPLATRSFQSRLCGQKVHERNERVPGGTQEKGKGSRQHGSRRSHRRWGSGRRKVGEPSKEASYSQDKGCCWKWKACELRQPSTSVRATEHSEAEVARALHQAGKREGYGGEFRERAFHEEAKDKPEESLDCWKCTFRCSGTAEFGECSRQWTFFVKASVGGSSKVRGEPEVEEEEKEKEKEEEEGFRWFFVWVQQQQFNQLFRVEAPVAEESGKETWVSPPPPHGSRESGAVRHESDRWWDSRPIRSGYLLGPSSILLSDPGSSPPWKSAQGREGTLQPSRGHRHPERWRYRKASRHAGRKVSCGGDGRPRGVMGDGQMAGGVSARGSGCGIVRHPPRSEETSEGDGQSFRERLFLEGIGAILGSKPPWPWRVVRPPYWPRKRQAWEKRKRKREEIEKQEGTRRRLVARQDHREGGEDRRWVEVRDAVGCSPTRPNGDPMERRSLEAGSLPGLDPGVQGGVERRGLEAASISLDYDGPCAPESRGLRPREVSLSSGPVVLDQEAWRDRLISSSDIAQFGAVLGWGLAKGFVAHGFDLVLSLVKPAATLVALNKMKGLFPLPVDLSSVFNGAWPAGGFSADQCAQAWTCLAAAAVNHLHGEKPPFPKRRGGVSVKKAMEVLETRVVRFLSQKVDAPLNASDVWAEVNEKSVSYTGEEVAVACPLTVDQVTPSVPPQGHGGSVELAPLLVGRARFLIEHPEQVLLRRDQVKPGRNTSKVHVVAGQERSLFMLLFQRGVIDFIPEGDVYSDSSGPYLSGLFGVQKPGKFTDGGLPVLRLIMNLIPSIGLWMLFWGTFRNCLLHPCGNNWCFLRAIPFQSPKLICPRPFTFLGYPLHG